MSQDYDSSEDSDFATAIAATAFAINLFDFQNQKRTTEGLETSLPKLKSKKEDGVAEQPNYSSDDSEYATTIAATAFAINLFEETDIQNQKRTTEQLENSLTKPKSKKEDGVTPESADTNGKMPEKAASSVPTVMKTPTFSNHESDVDTRPRPTPLLTVKPTPLEDEWEGSHTRAGIAKSNADAWEKAQMAKIKKWYEKRNHTILSWEDEKKAKAKRRMDRTESNLEERRARALEHYRNEMSRINQIAEGARAQVEEKRRNEESKTKEKADKIRSTGKVRVTCFCF